MIAVDERIKENFMRRLEDKPPYRSLGVRRELEGRARCPQRAEIKKYTDAFFGQALGEDKRCEAAGDNR